MMEMFWPSWRLPLWSAVMVSEDVDDGHWDGHDGLCVAFVWFAVICILPFVGGWAIMRSFWTWVGTEGTLTIVLVGLTWLSSVPWLFCLTFFNLDRLIFGALRGICWTVLFP